MKKLLSPTFFALVAIAFLLPFVSVSCNADALQQGLQGLGGDAAGDTGDLGIPEGGIEVSASGLQIILNDVDAPEGLDDLESGLGAGAPATDTTEDFPGRMFAILAAAAAILGLGLSFLRERIGAIMALVLGLGAALFLFLMKGAIDGEIGPAQLFGFQVSYKYGFWLALLFAVAAAGAGLWRLLGMRTVVVPAPGMTEPPAEPPPA